MQISGTITLAMPEVSGTSRAGKQWRKREYIVEYSHGQYPKSIVFQVMGQKIDEMNIQQGQEYDLEIDFEAREWQGRYFLQANCWKATAKTQQLTAPAQPQSTTPNLDSLEIQGYQQSAVNVQNAVVDAEDLPF